MSEDIQASSQSQPDERKFEDLTDEEKSAVIRQRYYSSANTHGVVLSDLLVIAGGMGQYAGTAHYRAIAGAGLTARALSEIASIDKEAAQTLFKELADGLLYLGKDLDLTQEAGEEA